MVAQSLAQALVALERMSTFLIAEELPEPYLLDKSAGPAVDVDGDFRWETAKPTEDSNGEKKKEEESKRKESKPRKKRGNSEKNTSTSKSSWWKKSSAEDTAEDRADDEKGTTTPPHVETPFALNGLKMTIPHGSFVAIVGRVGSGKVRATVYYLMSPSVKYFWRHRAPSSSPLSEKCGVCGVR